MSNWNYNEDQLRTWRPRRPSPELRAQIFAEPAVSAARALSEFSRWLVPSFGCFLLAVGSLSQRLPGNGHIMAQSLLTIGTQTAAAEARQHSEINAIPAKRMEYSIHAALTQSLTSPILTSYTNKLIHQ
jgi:hypothetical protein